MSIFELNHWKSKQGILDSANNAQVIQTVPDLLTLSRCCESNAIGFRNRGLEREARICQLKAEMFAARAEELSHPKCSICGNTKAVRSTLVCERCFFANLLDPEVKARYQSGWTVGDSPQCKCCGRPIAKESYVDLCSPCMDWAYQQDPYFMGRLHAP